MKVHQLRILKSGPALIDPESGAIMKPEAFSKRVLGPGLSVLLSLAFLIVALHIFCLSYSNGCCGKIQVFNINIVPKALINRASSRVLCREGRICLNPFQSSRYVGGDEHLVPWTLKLQKLWTSKDWRIKVSTFTDLFSGMMNKGLLKPCLKVLCLGAGQGHEVLALKEMGIYNAIGIDLTASPPLVLKGDMHSQPFRRDTFDFEYCNVFDHALLTSMFVDEIERTLKPGGCVVIHLMLKNRTQEAYRPSNLQNVGVLIALFQNFEVVQVGGIDAFGLDTEVILRKPFSRKRLGLAT